MRNRSGVGVNDLNSIRARRFDGLGPVEISVQLLILHCLIDLNGTTIRLHARELGAESLAIGNVGAESSVLAAIALGGH